MSDPSFTIFNRERNKSKFSYSLEKFSFCNLNKVLFKIILEHNLDILKKRKIIFWNEESNILLNFEEKIPGSKNDWSTSKKAEVRWRLTVFYFIFFSFILYIPLLNKFRQIANRDNS